jgi:TetR/AcrR family transcriptional regulator, cholesterol catabolism regulator
VAGHVIGNGSLTRLTPKGAASRARILDVAARLFDEAGYHTTSMQDIVQATGISKAGIYHYFTSKDEILMAIHNLLIDELIERQAEHLAKPQSATAILRSMVSDMVEEMDQHPAHFRVFNGVFTAELQRLSSESREEVARKRRILHANFRHVIELGVSSGEFEDPVERDLAVFGIVSMCWAYNRWPMPPATTPSSATKTLFELALRGLARRD